MDSNTTRVWWECQICFTSQSCWMSWFVRRNTHTCTWPVTTQTLTLTHHPRSPAHLSIKYHIYSLSRHNICQSFKKYTMYLLGNSPAQPTCIRPSWEAQCDCTLGFQLQQICSIMSQYQIHTNHIMTITYHTQYSIISKGNLANTCEKNILKNLNSFTSSQFIISTHNVLLNPITN